jgi:hypothetical protein
MRIKKVEYIEEFKLKILFNDNKTKIVDLEEIVKKGRGMFLPLKKLTYFSQVAVDNDNITICWPNGADLSPDVLYEMGEDIQKEKKPLTRQRKIIDKKARVKYQTKKRPKSLKIT